MIGELKSAQIIEIYKEADPRTIESAIDLHDSIAVLFDHTWLHLIDNPGIDLSIEAQYCLLDIFDRDEYWHGLDNIYWNLAYYYLEDPTRIPVGRYHARITIIIDKLRNSINLAIDELLSDPKDTRYKHFLICGYFPL